MIYSVNKVILIGHVSSKNIPIRHVQNGTPFATFFIKTGKLKKRQNGEKIMRNDQHNIIMWGKLATIYANNIKQGQLVYVEGEMQTKTYIDSGNKKRYFTEVVCEKFKFLSSKEIDNESFDVEDDEMFEDVNDNQDVIYDNDNNYA